MNAHEIWHLKTKRIGRRVLVFDEVDSTNSRAAALGHDTENDGLAVLAARQTRGRGQHGHSWQCPAGNGVLLSLVVFPPPELRRPAMLTAWATASVCKVVRRFLRIPATIKWPNDILVRDRKVCGILIEQSHATVVGIGLNINQTRESLANAGLPLAGSLAMFTREVLVCHDIARLLIEQLDREYCRLLSGDMRSLETSWKRGIDLVGKQAVVECLDRVHHGVVHELGLQGLQLDVGNGNVIKLPPESICHVTAV